MRLPFRSKRFSILLGLIFIFALGFSTGAFTALKGWLPEVPWNKEEVQQSPYVAFLLETYDLIKTEYWQMTLDDQLANLFQKATEKVLGGTYELETKDRAGLEKMLTQVLSEKTDEEKNDLVPQIADVVMVNLQPLGRSRLLGKKQTEEIYNMVENKDPESNQLAALGVDETADDSTVASAYEDKSAEVESSGATPEEKAAEMVKLDRAFQSLDTKSERERYIETGVETTIQPKKIGADVYYLQLQSFSATTYEDLVQTFQNTPPTAQQTSLILDLRNNPGGFIDGLPYVLGAFYGEDTLSHQMLKQGNKKDFKTKTPKIPQLAQFKKILIFVNEATGSSAEAMTASLKKYNVGLVVGVPTRGWGTVERVMPLKSTFDDQKFSLLLVETLTLRDDGIPIEGSGIIPDIDMRSKTWKTDLLGYFNQPSLVTAVDQLWK
ncbi:MAG: hypothetical protein COY80_02130 [Candidatus Pacebacteria bacterium CG_4_10_14_0_8_um_filter_42_14]|nr:MAG: hypothetical protein COY80_02130 [Candidatus Pacebacteria bacterium CG_4_10_14_0_8_um_filter_42_14]